MMFNNGMNGNNGNFNYGGVQPQKNNNVLTPEEIAKLQKKTQEFSLAITEEEMLRGICTHRSPDGMSDTLIIDPITGEATCSICGYKFKPIDPDTNIDDIKDDIERILNIIQTIKLMYVDLPPAAAKEYFPIIPLIEKIPQFFEFAVKNMNKHEMNGAWNYGNRGMGAVNMYNSLQNMFNGFGFGGNPNMMGQMNNGQNMYDPNMYNQNMNGQMNQGPVQGPGNGFGYPGANNGGIGNPAFGAMNNPQMNQGNTYTPGTSGYQFTTNNQNTQQVSGPTAPNGNGTETVTQKVNI